MSMTDKQLEDLFKAEQESDRAQDAAPLIAYVNRLILEARLVECEWWGQIIDGYYADVALQHEEEIKTELEKEHGDE